MGQSKLAAVAALRGVGIEPRLLSAHQAAAYLGLGVTSFRARVKAGKLPGPVGDLKRWDRHELDRCIGGSSEPVSCEEQMLEVIRRG